MTNQVIGFAGKSFKFESDPNVEIKSWLIRGIVVVSVESTEAVGGVECFL